jgi:hypothetical protein
LTDAAGVEDQQKERRANRLQSPGMVVQITLAVIQDFRKGRIFFVGSCAKFVIWMGRILWNEVYFAVLLHAVATTHDEHGLRGMLLQPIAFEEPFDSSDQGKNILQTFHQFGPAALHRICLPVQLASVTCRIRKARDVFVLAQSDAQHSGMKIAPR